MIQIGDKIVSQDIFDVLFACDYAACKGACCVEGDSGAPLDPGEADQLRKYLPLVEHLLSPQAKAIIAEQGVSYFIKPISCQLYPIRLTRYKDFTAVNYHKWSICKCALKRGKQLQLPVYKFLEGPLTRAFGEEWYAQLEDVARLLQEEQLET